MSEHTEANDATELKRLAAIGKRWETDSSLETWFPFTAEKIAKLHAALSMVRAEHLRMMQEISEIGYSEFNYTASMACAVNDAYLHFRDADGGDCIERSLDLCEGCRNNLLKAFPALAKKLEEP